jgi:hypothetical protein
MMTSLSDVERMRKRFDRRGSRHYDSRDTARKSFVGARDK